MMDAAGTRIARVSAIITDGFLTRLKTFTSDINSTNWVIFTGTIVGMITALVYLTGIIIQRVPQEATFGMWLAFVASWIGFGVRQFRIKRETHSEFSPQNKPKETPSDPVTPGT